MIFSIIENMSFSKNLSEAAELSLEGKIVQDADRIESIGANRHFACCLFRRWTWAPDCRS